MEEVIKKIFFAVLIYFIFLSPLLAGELYSCKDSQGNAIVTSSPQDGMTDCVLKDTYKERTPYEKHQGEPNERQQKSLEKQREEEQKRGCLNNCQNTASSCAKDCYASYTNNIGRINDCLVNCLGSKNRCISNCQR